MPTETVIIVTGIVFVFAAFGATLIWTDYYTRNVRTPGAMYFSDREFKTPDRLSDSLPRGDPSFRAR